MISLYIPGSSLIHRIPAGWKLSGLAVLAAAMFFVPASYLAAGVFVAISLAGYVLAGLGLRTLLKDLRQLGFILAFLVITQVIFLSPTLAAANTARVISIILLAQVLTRTTRTDGIINTAEKIFAPFRRFGVNPEKIGLALALVLSSIGQISAFVSQVRDAQKVRGVRIPPWSWLVPVLVLSLKYADDVADALVARGQQE